MGGRNAVAGALATGMTAERHGLVGLREPEALTMEIRQVDARSWTQEPFWSLIADKGHSCSMIGWPATEPTSCFDGVRNGSLTMVAGQGYSSREDPADAWLLPPWTVSPDAMRATVRQARRHRDALSPEEAPSAKLLSAAAIARTLLMQGGVDLLACWLEVGITNDPARNEEQLTLFARTLEDLVDASGECSMALLCLPMLPEQELIQSDRVHGTLFCDGDACRNIGTAPVMNDTQLPELILGAFGLEVEEHPMPRQDPDELARSSDVRARELIKAGNIPVLTPGRQRIYSRFVGKRCGSIGMELFARRQYDQARPWLEEGSRTGMQGSFLAMLVLSLASNKDSARLSRLAENAAVPTFIRGMAAAASAILEGDAARAIELTRDLDPSSPMKASCRMEMFLRAGDEQAAREQFVKAEAVFLKSRNIRALRLGYIAARRTRDQVLVSRVASALAVFEPHSLRRKRFINSD